MAPGADPNQRRDLNVARPCVASRMDQTLQAIMPNGLQTYYSQQPGVVIGGTVFVAVLLLVVMVMISMRMKKRKATRGDYTRIVMSEKEDEEDGRYYDEVISSSHV
ncbi:uncharacterized protein EV420DRAFT_1482212 [Desarmillaria tabescens]|uniref:Uncharacterized protein n=1 Tax=Armillaria tabescens TaxID=1929756 RepID=A0AA39K064_ARMTA|nr:uncharacterized protein EV420DRAFT_1482212 [Desarmillaria tabescens]KAK0452125.1 hypothetical protein EV420DRAFT_1482212 [Desarmillaria tabescens]